MPTWGEVFAHLLERHHWSQAELARRAGVSANTLSNIVLGSVSPSGRSLERLADALGVTVGTLHQWHSGVLPLEPATGGGDTPGLPSDTPTEATGEFTVDQLKFLLDMLPERERHRIVSEAKQKALRWLMEDEAGVKRGDVPA